MGLYGLSSKEIARDGCFHYLPTSARRSGAGLPGASRPLIAMLSNSAIRRLASREPTGMNAGG